MGAIQQLTVAGPASFLKLYAPPADVELVPAAHTTHSRVRSPEKRSKSKERQLELIQSVDDAGFELADELSRQFESKSMSAETAAAHARQSTLAGYWQHVMLPEWSDRAKNTISNYDNALSLWERCAPKSDNPRWAGMPLGKIRKEYCEAFLTAAAKVVSVGTVKSRWKHLHAIFNHAADNGVIARAPNPELPTEGNKLTAILTDEQLDAGYRALADHLSLQVAFVVAVNTGLRPVDLFLLRRDALQAGNRPCLAVTAKKTGKAQTLPLADVTVKQLARLPDHPDLRGYYFGHLTSVEAADPERSRAARDRNALFKSLLANAGIDFIWPWQTCRATCNERLESHREGSGQFMLGHGNTLNSKSYREPSKLIYEAVNSVPQPSCFKSLADGTQTWH